MRLGVEIPLKLQWAVLVVTILLELVFGWRMPAEIPLFFCKPFGKAQLTSPYWIVVLPVLEGLILITSTLVGKYCDKSKVTRALFIWLSFGAALVLLAALIYVLYLVY